MPSLLRYNVAQYWILGEGAKRFPYNKACDISEPCCFCCGYYAEYWDEVSNIEQRWEKTALHKAHLQPKSLGGLDVVENIVLLCQCCHDKTPDYIDPQDMLNWMSNQKYVYSPFEKYKETLIECKNLGITEKQLIKLLASPDYKHKLRASKDKVTMHFGAKQGGLKPSTLALLVRDAINYREEYIQLDLFNHPKSH